MSKKIKNLIEQDFTSTFDGVNEMIFISLCGVSGTDNNDLRCELLGKGIKVKVIKNSLAIRSFGQHGVEGLKDVLVGPCAVAYGGDNIVDLAKEVADWDKKLDKMEIKGGFMEGQVLDGAQAKSVAKMKTRVELQGEVVMLANAPGSRLASAVNSPASAIAGCIKTLIENKEEAA